MNLKRIIEQTEAAAQYYDLGKDFVTFIRSMNATTESVKNRFEQAIGAKLKGKKIRARASRGYKQFEKDYEINVVSVSLDDYYDNYVVVVKGSNGKEYFLKPGFKVQIIGAAEAEKQEAPPEPAQKKPEQPAAQPPPQPAPQAPAQPEQPQQQQQPVKEDDGGAELVRKYPVEAIEKDLQSWLPRLLMTPNKNLRQYIPRDGVSRSRGRKTVISYGVVIPTDELPGLSADQVKAELAQAGKFASDVSDIENFYTLDKFDVRGGKYVIIVRKVTNY